MPKFSTVQAYSDSNSNVQTLSYQQATGGASEGAAEKVRTEKVVNAYGSTAGANSGEFHVYRQARAREMGRMANLEQQKEQQQKDMEFQQTVLENKLKDEERTAKRRKKRQRQKEAKKRRQNLEKAGITLGAANDADAEIEGDDDDEDEFAVPLPQQPKDDDNSQSNEPSFANDGSFLEMMKKKMAEEAAAKEIAAARPSSLENGTKSVQ
mmetsp:Transcript_20671/g.44731  ORF Transcript_20671/g.44731 Transcript_20671/m.44731 type:complete len:210 (-) Transcript_20671:1279-1908(-)